MKPLEGRPGDSIPAFDFDKRKLELTKKYGQYIDITDADVISSSLYEDVFEDYAEMKLKYGHITDLPTEYVLR